MDSCIILSSVSEKVPPIQFFDNGYMTLFCWFQDQTQHLSRLTLGLSKRASSDISRPNSCIRMTLVDERLPYGLNVAKPSGELVISVCLFDRWI